MGKSKDHPLYGWDNEYGHYEHYVRGFKASRYLVSNHEYLEFVKEGGYTAREHWTDEGWNWVRYSGAAHPLFWIPEGASYKFRTMAQIIEMPWDWPVEVNYLEAKAFCKWLAKKTEKPLRLPTEEQWYLLRDSCAKYPISPTGTKPRATSTWNTGPLPAP